MTLFAVLAVQMPFCHRETLLNAPEDLGQIALFASQPAF